MKPMLRQGMYTLNRSLKLCKLVQSNLDKSSWVCKATGSSGLRKRLRITKYPPQKIGLVYALVLRLDHPMIIGLVYALPRSGITGRGEGDELLVLCANHIDISAPQLESCDRAPSSDGHRSESRPRWPIEREPSSCASLGCLHSSPSVLFEINSSSSKSCQINLLHHPLSLPRVPERLSAKCNFIK